MKLYGKKFANKYVNKQVERKTETKDGILWSIDEVNYRCSVAVEGGSELVVAHYPRNWKDKPYWLKIGNAVRILHRAGVRGYVEVIGEGRAIRSGARPQASTPVDIIVTGGEIAATTPSSYSLTVTPGTVRINGNIYAFSVEDQTGSLLMEDPANATMGSSSQLMGEYTYNIQLDPPPQWNYFRYDLIEVGTDGVVSVVTGVAVFNDPVKPAVSAEHVQIGDYILVQNINIDGSASTVENYQIGAEWTTREIKFLGLSSDWTTLHPWPPDHVSENVGPGYNIVNVKTMDQYYHPIDVSTYPPYGGPTVTLRLVHGEGAIQVWDGEQSSYEDIANATKVRSAYMTGEEINFTYFRNFLYEGSDSFDDHAQPPCQQRVPEPNPAILHATFNGEVGIESTLNIILLDEWGCAEGWERTYSEWITISNDADEMRRLFGYNLGFSLA